VDGVARVDDVLHQQDVTLLERSVDHVRETKVASRGAGAIAGRAHELELGRNAQAAHQV
jgi:hypothetical protein